jgi:hypothetical protein
MGDAGEAVMPPESQRSTSTSVGSYALRGAELSLPPVTLRPTWRAEVLTSPRVLRLPLAGSTPAVTSISLLDAMPKVSSYCFPRAVAAPVALAAPPRPATAQPPASAEPAVRRPDRLARTRIAPPGDVVRMDERLWFLLQPDLETLLR